MAIAGIKVLFIGKSWDVPYEVRVCNKTSELFAILAQFKPDVVVTSTFRPTSLNVADFETRKKWIHVDQNANAEAVTNAIGNCYSSNIWDKHQYQDTNKLVTVYTGTYNTGPILRDTYQSLRDQTYQNWEWVAVDDSSDDGTWERLLEIANDDHRVRPIRINHSGKIGYVKDVATRLADGEYLIHSWFLSI
jgi:hypothetical protein